MLIYIQTKLMIFNLLERRSGAFFDGGCAYIPVGVAGWRMKSVLLVLVALCVVAGGAVAGDVEILTDGVSGRVTGIRPQAYNISAGTGVGMTGPTAGRYGAAAVFNPEIVAMILLTEHSEVVGLSDPVEQLVLDEVKESRSGFTHVRYNQMHMGLPILGGEAIVHFDHAGNLQMARTSIARNLPASVTPVIDAAEAKELALAAGEETNDRSFSLGASQAELLVVPLDILQRTGTPDSRLVWKVRVYDYDSGGKRFDEHIYLDANNGAVLHRESNIRNAIQHYTIDCSVEQPPYDCALDLPIDYGDPPMTYYHGRSYDQPVRGPHPDDTTIFFGSTDVDNNFDQLIQVHDLVWNAFGLDGANNQGGTNLQYPQYTDAAVHYDGFDPGPCPNAFYWPDSNGLMGFCLGASVPDVVAHEYGHALQHHQGPSFTYSGESGAIQESHSDVFGEYGEDYIEGSNDWIFGATANGFTGRDLANPHNRTSPTSGLPYPDRYFDSNFYCGSGDNYGVHANSTVPGHAFYLFSEGGEHNGCEIVGQGIEAANQIYFEAIDNYFNATESFNQAYTDLLAACPAAGYDSTVCAELAKALQAIEIDQSGGKCNAVFTEAAPPCAVNHVGSFVAARSNMVPATMFAPGEDIWVDGTGGTDGREIDFHLVASDTARAIWSAITPISTTTLTVGAGGGTVGFFMTSGIEGLFDIIADANLDGFYQPWADAVTTIEVNSIVTGVGEGAPVPVADTLERNFPNPFNPATTIRFSVSTPGLTTLSVYNGSGRLVRTLVDRVLPRGAHEAGVGRSKRPGRSGGVGRLLLSAHRAGVHQYRTDDSRPVIRRFG